MNIEKNKVNDSLIVKISGRLDTNTAPDLESSLKEDIEAEDKIVLDLIDLDYISSAGLRVLLGTHKALMSRNAKLIIKNTKDEVMDVFDITGFSSFLNIED